MLTVKKGTVYLIGAGPGDPGLLTLKAKKNIRAADVIIYDNLANRTLLGFAKNDAELVYVGKKAGSHTMRQDEINRLIVAKAKQGKNVVRLKGGDPFIFGRGGEEAQELIEAGIAFEVVCGITSAISVPAYAGIPLTHRDHTSTVAFITGHEDPNKGESSISWDKVATGVGTLVFLMGVGNLKHIAETLISHGRSPVTPVAVIMNGTMPNQKTVVGVLQDIAGIVKKNSIKPPAVIVVGEVVNLREKLNWYETRPLFGKKIIITRAREQASEFIEKLTLLGAECIEFPTIEVTPPETWDPVDLAVKTLAEYDWIIFTSVNGVRFFIKRLFALGKDVRDIKGCKIGAIGPKTAAVWHDLGIKPDLVPSEYRAEAIVAAFKKMEGPGRMRILIPRALKAREILPEELRKMGAEVDVVPVYQTIQPDHDTARIKQMLEQGTVDMVTFTSSSTVNNFLSMFTDFNLREKMKSVAVACIGPVTAKTAEEKGLSVNLVPQKYTIDSLTEALVAYLQPESLSNGGEVID
jgi:uroporphyrinogen III methyltransferase/synthase